MSFGKLLWKAGRVTHSSFSLQSSAEEWFASDVSHLDIDHYFQQKILRFSNVPFVPVFATAIYDPKIFHVMKPSKAARFAGIDGWIRMMWQGAELPRWVREAIAVAVSTANSCDY